MPRRWKKARGEMSSKEDTQKATPASGEQEVEVMMIPVGKGLLQPGWQGLTKRTPRAKCLKIDTYAEINMEEKYPLRVLIDTGAEINIIRKEYLPAGLWTSWNWTSKLEKLDWTSKTEGQIHHGEWWTTGWRTGGGRSQLGISSAGSS